MATIKSKMISFADSYAKFFGDKVQKAETVLHRAVVPLIFADDGTLTAYIPIKVDPAVKENAKVTRYGFTILNAAADSDMTITSHALKLAQLNGGTLVAITDGGVEESRMTLVESSALLTIHSVTEFDGANALGDDAEDLAHIECDKYTDTFANNSVDPMDELIGEITVVNGATGTAVTVMVEFWCEVVRKLG